MPRGLLQPFVRATQTKRTDSVATPRSFSIEGVSPIVERKPRSRRASMDHIKRSSISSIADLSGKAKKRKSIVSPTESNAATMQLEVESPPLVFYGTKTESTGALFSGLINLHVLHSVAISEWTARIDVEFTSKKPIVKDCKDCATKTTTIKSWNFFDKPVSLNAGPHKHPLNHLIKGDLPATTHGELGSIEYYFRSTAHTASGETIQFQQKLNISRALHLNDQPHHSRRIFPPTKLELELEMPRHIHPIGEFPLHMRMNHMMTRNETNKTRWLIRKCHWRIEEEMRVISPACALHMNKPGSAHKSVLHHSSRDIGGGSLNDCFKCDWSSHGIAEVGFKASINAGVRATCDVDSGTGLTVEHTLHVDMVICEEFSPTKRPDSVIPTGNARILKGRFRVLVTEREGLGISWDQEQPPLYSDVPSSPPGYATMEDVNLNDLSSEDRGLLFQ